MQWHFDIFCFYEMHSIVLYYIIIELYKSMSSAAPFFYVKVNLIDILHYSL